MSDDEVALMQQLHDEHAAALWRFALRLVDNDRARAEDVVQETLLRAWRHRAVLESAPPALRAWLFTVARNIVIDEWRSRRVQLETTVADVPEAASPVTTPTTRCCWRGSSPRRSPGCRRSTVRCCSSATTAAGRWRRRRGGSGCPRAR